MPQTLKKNKDPILCYIEENWAYFTRASLKNQDGDDWEDRPYEHNAGAPYEEKPGQIVRVAFEVPWLTAPCDGHSNSPYSVEDINQKMLVPWLQDGYSDVNKVKIWAGTTLSEFKRIIKALEGKIYTEEK